MSEREKLFKKEVIPHLVELIQVCRQYDMSISCAIVYEEIVQDGKLVSVEMGHGCHLIDTEYGNESAYKPLLACTALTQHSSKQMRKFAHQIVDCYVKQLENE